MSWWCQINMDPDLQQLLESMKAEKQLQAGDTEVNLMKCQQWNRLHFDLSGSVRPFAGNWLASKLQVKLTGRRRWTLFFFGLTCIFSTLAESAFICGVLVTRYFEVTLPVSTDVTAGRAALPLTDRRVALSPCRSNWALPFDLKNICISWGFWIRSSLWVRERGTGGYLRALSNSSLWSWSRRVEECGADCVILSVRIDHSWSDGIDVLEVRGVHFQLILVVCETFGV